MADRYASLKQGLVGAWIPSVSGSGLLLPDLSGRGNHGSLTNMDASDWVSSQYGRALDFDGSNDFVSMSALPLTGDPAFTIEAWIRTTDATIGQTVFLSGNESVGLGAIGLCIGVRGTGTVGFEFAGNTHYAVNGIVANTIHHVAAVKTPGPINTTSQVYIDGTLRAVTGTPTTSTPNIGSARATIGQFGLPANGLRFSGLIWQIGAYDRALSPNQIRLLASEPGIGFKPAKKLSSFSTRYTYKPPKAKVFEGVRVRDHDYASLREGLVGAWCPSLPNGGSGNTLPDQSGRGNHGTLTNMGPEDWVSGQYGRALEFDGIDDRVIGSNLITSFPFSISAFFKSASTSLTFRSAIGFGNSANITNHISFGFTDTNKFRYNPRSSFLNDALVDSVLTYNDNAWHHAVAVSSSANNHSLYIDGTLVATSSTDLGTVPVLNQFAIGCLPRSTNVSFFPGMVDDIRLYSRALTESEIRLLASRRGIGLQPSPTRFIAREKKTGLRRKILTGQT